jgi:hypothetical protein
LPQEVRKHFLGCLLGAKACLLGAKGSAAGLLS